MLYTLQNKQLEESYVSANWLQEDQISHSVSAWISRLNNLICLSSSYMPSLVEWLVFLESIVNVMLILLIDLNLLLAVIVNYDAVS